MKSFIYRVLSVLLVVISAAVPAMAAGFDRQVYLVVAAGQADTDARLSEVDEINGDDTAYELGLGYAFSPYLSVEGSYHDFGEPYGYAGCPRDLLCVAIVPYVRENVSLDGWSAALRGNIPLTDHLSLFGRVGLLAWDSSALNPGLNDSGTDLLYGAGIAADLNDRFGLQLSYERVDLDIDSLKLGVMMRF